MILPPVAVEVIDAEVIAQYEHDIWRGRAPLSRNLEVCAGALSGPWMECRAGYAEAGQLDPITPASIQLHVLLWGQTDANSILAIVAGNPIPNKAPILDFCTYFFDLAS
jgi:hypothetical protein